MSARWSVCGAVVVLGACASGPAPHGRYVAPAAMGDAVTPPSLDLSTITPRLAPFQPIEGLSDGAGKTETGDPEAQKSQLIADANDDATRTVIDGSFKGAVHEWRYKDGEIYEIPTRVGATTTFQLEPEEEKSDDVDMGDARGWGEVSYGWSGDSHGHVVRHLVFRPEKRGADTDVVIYTNLRTVHLLMRRVDDQQPYVLRVRLRMLELERSKLMDEQLAQQREKKKSAAGVSDSGGCTSGQYRFSVTEGNPSWVPTVVFRECKDDIAKVVIQFPANVRWSKVPALETDGGVGTYSYDPKEHCMRVDGLFRKAVLSLGDDTHGYERVKIRAIAGQP